MGWVLILTSAKRSITKGYLLPPAGLLLLLGGAIEDSIRVSAAPVTLTLTP